MQFKQEALFQSGAWYYSGNYYAWGILSQHLNCKFTSL